MFELYASGTHSYRSLVHEAARRGLRTATGARLTIHSIEKILTNPFYCGVIKMRSTGETFAGVHEPIISVSLFEAAHDVRAGKAGKKVTRHRHTYAGLFRCANCSAAMTPELQKARVYYRCHTPRCSTTTVREDTIESAVSSLLQEVRLNDDTSKRIEEDFRDWVERRGHAADPATLKLKLAKLDGRMERLTDALLDRHIDPDVFAARKQTLMLERAQIEEEQSRLTSSGADLDRLRRFLELVKNLAGLYETADAAEKRQIVNFVTSNRKVDGRQPQLEPTTWVSALRPGDRVSGGAPSRDTSRTLARMLRCTDVALSSATNHDAAFWE